MTALNLPATIDPPTSLPVDYLSASSLDLYARCPEKWKRKYIDHQEEPANGVMVLGGAVGAALAQHYGWQLERGDGLSTDDVLDEFSAQWDERISSEEVMWGKDKPGSLKDSGAGVLRAYHHHIAPDVIPVSIERQCELCWPDAPFKLVGYLDMETVDGRICDFKVSDKRWSQDKARAQLQPTIYLAARRAEGNPAVGFQYHTMIRTKTPTAELVPTERTERQLDLLTNRVFSIARSIEWRWINDCWQGTPPDLAWLCRGCGYNQDCPWSLA